MGLAGAGRPKKMDDLGAIGEGQLGQGQDALFVERRLESEVKTGERFNGGQSRQGQRCPDPPVLAHRSFLDEQLIEGFDAVDLALLNAPQRGVEHFEGAWHPQRHQAVFDAVDGSGSGGHD